MSLQAFQRGEPAALGGVVERCLPWLWSLARRGFVVERDGVPLYVRGIARADLTETQVEAILGACLQPDRRARLQRLEDVDAAVLTEAAEALLGFAERAGSVVAVVAEEERAEVPREAEALDPCLAEGRAPQVGPLPPDANDVGHTQAEREVAASYVGALDERSRALVQHMFVEGKSAAETATIFDCGRAAVVERELRVRRKLGHLLRRTHDGPAYGAAHLDALLADRVTDALPPPVTLMRLRTNVLRRVHAEAPRPYGVRLAWGLGAAAVATLLWLAMFVGLLPSYEDDVFPDPAVEVACDGPCRAGGTARFRVLAPRDATHVAILHGRGKAAKPLLTAPGGASLRVPFGSDQRAVPIPYAVTLPAEATPSSEFVALFSVARLGAKEIRGTVDGTLERPGTLTATTTLGAR